MMLATKPADLILALQKAAAGFTEIVDLPTDNDIINIWQLLLPVLMKTKYDDLTLTHNLSGVIIPTERYDQIYLDGDYLILQVITLYDDTIYKYAKRTEVHWAEGKHEVKRNERSLYKTANNSCKNFILEVVNDTWYKELEDPDTFYNYAMALKLLNRLTESCSGLHTVDVVDILEVMKTLFSNAEGIP